MFTGTYTAIVTPFKDGKVNELAFERLIKAQVKGGVDGIVPVGTTGESPTLSFEEHMYVVELAVKFAAGKFKVLAGTGGNSTDEAIYLTIAAEKGGADGSLQVAPYYNKPRRKVCSNTFAPSLMPPNCPSCFTAFPGGVAWKSAWTRSNVSRASAKILSASRKPGAMPTASASSVPPSGQSSLS